MSVDTFGILLANVIYAAYIGVLSDESEWCVNGRRVQQGHSSGTVLVDCSIRVICNLLQ